MDMLANEIPQGIQAHGCHWHRMMGKLQICKGKNGGTMLWNNVLKCYLSEIRLAGHDEEGRAGIVIGWLG
jgi:hypothetical protein